MKELHEATTDLLWSLWSELGAPGGGRAHRQLVLDPEPLIAFTPHLARRDNRLLGLAFDWCINHSAQVSKSRLKGLSRSLPESARSKLAGFNGALEPHGVAWRPTGDPLELERHRERIALPMDRHALLVFRIRAIAGVSTRADVLTRLLFTPASGASVADLTPSGMSRRGAELTLNELARAGLVRVHGSPRQRRFNLTDRESFSRLVGADRLSWWDWRRVFALVARLTGFVEAEDQSARINRVAAVATRKEVAGLAAAMGISAPPLLDGRRDAFDVLAKWSLQVARGLARGEM